MDETNQAATATPAADLGGDWFDPLEEAVRGQVRGFIERLLEEELEAALGRGRYQRRPAATGRRHGHRERGLRTTFRARAAGGAAGTARGRDRRAGSGRARSCPPTGA